MGLSLSSAGLVLRPSAIEVFEARRGLRGVELVTAVPMPLAANDRHSDPSEAIRQALAQAKIKSTRLAVSVAGQDVLLRSFVLPLLPKAEWLSAVQFEARKHIPFKTEELVWDFHVTEHRAEKRMDVVFVGIRADTFARIESWLKAAGVTPTFIESQSASLARLTPPVAKAGDAEFVGLVDIGQDTAHIVIAKDQVPYFIRDVDLMIGPPAAKAPELDAPGLSVPAAVLAAPAAAPMPESESSSPDPRVEMLLSELRLSLDFFTRENPSTSVRRLCLFGDEAALRAWGPWLAQQLGAAVEIGSIPLQQGGRPASPQTACAAGLAMRELQTSRVKLNFSARPVVAVSAGRPKTGSALHMKLGVKLGPPALRPLAAQAAVALVVLGLLKAMGNQQIAAVRQQNADIVRNFPDPGWRLKDRSRTELKGIQDQVNRKVAFLQRLVQQRVSVAEKMSMIAKSLPDGVWLDVVSFNNRSEYERGPGQPKLVLQGACYLINADSQMTSISEFAQRLRRDQTFFRDFATAEVGEITSMVDRNTQAAYKTFRLDCGIGKR